MMERSADAWEHNQFKEVVVKVANIEIYYKVWRTTISSRRNADFVCPEGAQFLPSSTTAIAE